MKETNNGFKALLVATLVSFTACAPIETSESEVVVCDDKADPYCAPDREVVVIEDKEKTK